MGEGGGQGLQCSLSQSDNHGIIYVGPKALVIDLVVSLHMLLDPFLDDYNLFNN